MQKMELAVKQGKKSAAARRAAALEVLAFMFVYR
jgi:hypothetical protein